MLIKIFNSFSQSIIIFHFKDFQSSSIILNFCIYNLKIILKFVSINLPQKLLTLKNQTFSKILENLNMTRAHFRILNFVKKT